MASLVINEAEYEDLQREIGQLEFLNSPDLTLPYLAFMCGKVVATFNLMQTEPYERFGGKVEAWGAKFEALRKVAVRLADEDEAEYRAVPECLNCNHQGAQRGVDGDGQEAWLCDCCFAVRGSIEVDDIEWGSAPWNEDERETRAGWDADPQSRFVQGPPTIVDVLTYEADLREMERERALSPEFEPLSPEPAVELPEEPEAEPAEILRCTRCHRMSTEDEDPAAPECDHIWRENFEVPTAAPSAPSASEALAAAAAIATIRPEGFEPCPLCDRATFTNAKQRGDHIRNHNLDSLTCPKCESRVQRWDMGNHLANCSPVVPAEAEPVPQDSDPGPAAPDHTSRLMGVSPANPWTCPNCGTERVSASSRDVHIKRCPGGTCQWCGIVYVDMGTHRPVCEKKPRGGENCVHRWVLGRPQGEIVHARCDFCHATKEMPADTAPIGRGTR